MFDKLFTSLGRLVGSSRDPEGAQALESERRVWVRYPSGAQVNCLLADEAGSATLSARVTDISRGGIGLVVDREFEVGRFLSVELPAPSPEGVCRVLAYVLRAAPQPDGLWAVGCSFSIELTDDDLLAFGARRVRPPDEDQRAWVRFPCPVQASYQVVREVESAPRPARVMDLSPVGVGLQVSRPLDVGTLLSVEMRGAGASASLTILASVVRVTAQPDGEWTLGCNFIRELGEEELATLL